MTPKNRHQAILYAVMRQGYVSIESLAEELGVSSQTIRRDISELDRTGMLERRPGGASCRTTILNSSYNARQVEDFKEKEHIANNIKYTRDGYGINIEETNIQNGGATITEEMLSNARETVENIAIVDKDTVSNH